MSDIDLHTHSTASDGSLTPRELILAARQAGLRALALTDHDTTSGLREAVHAGRDIGVEVIPGCELSVSSPSGHMHLLGLWIPEHPQWLLTLLERVRGLRRERNDQMLAALRTLGIAIDHNEVKAAAGGESIGRPHIAQVLVDKGVVPDFDQAFHELIGSQGAAYVPKAKLTPGEAISALKKEQATVILAHPFSLGMSQKAFLKHISELKERGLDGLEVYYPEHSPEQTAFFARTARELGLVPSGGSDFHGRIKPGIHLGTGRGGLDLPYALLSRIKDRRRQMGLGLEVNWS